MFFGLGFGPVFFLTIFLLTFFLAAFSIFSESHVDTSDSEDDAFLVLAMVVFGLPLDKTAKPMSSLLKSILVNQYTIYIPMFQDFFSMTILIPSYLSHMLAIVSDQVFFYLDLNNYNLEISLLWIRKLSFTLLNPSIIRFIVVVMIWYPWSIALIPSRTFVIKPLLFKIINKSLTFFLIPFGSENITL